MLQATKETRRSPPARRQVAPPKPEAVQPPIISPTPEPHPVFGRALTAPGFDLKKQPIFTLVHWLKKARAIVDQVIADGPPSDKALGDALEPFNRIFDAILTAEARCASDVEKQMQAVVDYINWFQLGDDELDSAISSQQFKAIAANLSRAVAPLKPTKRVGKLARGKKLTRAGLLFRYQSFLIEEIHTLSWEMYGDPRYALQFIAFDDAVHDALKRGTRSRRGHPFLNPSKLVERANSVLKSLKVDRVHADVRQIASRSGGSR